MPVYALRGPEGCGTFGAESYEFIDFLAAAGQQIWQILPLCPTGSEYSPYKGLSAFGGNPVFISLAPLVNDGLLSKEALPKPVRRKGFDYEAVMKTKRPLLKMAFDRFERSGNSSATRRFQRFCKAEEHWLGPLSMFLVLAEEQGTTRWTTWDTKLRQRDPKTLKVAADRLAEARRFEKFLHYLFFEQWLDVKRYAQANQVTIFGDMPIFIDLESADVWADQQLVKLDRQCRPIEVAGVPPDYFSKTGQLWGNPVYNWPYHQSTGFRWWMERLAWNTTLYDTVRIDHFRGFEAYWAVPYGAENAIDGVWEKAPGRQLLKRVRDRLGMAAFVAEDLGYITPDVEYLRDRFGLPGMRVLQFAFDGKRNNIHLPHRHIQHSVAYTGTHDNDTLLGWYDSLTPSRRNTVLQYIRSDGSDVVWDLIRTVWASPADWAITTMQDILRLGSEARTNTPGADGSNWTWRMPRTGDLKEHIDRLAKLTDLYGRG